jgi:hypothetical protein
MRYLQWYRDACRSDATMQSSESKIIGNSFMNAAQSAFAVVVHAIFSFREDQVTRPLLDFTPRVSASL